MPELANEKVSNTIKQVNLIINVSTSLPTELKKAVECIQETARSQDQLDNGLAAVFLNIAAGKALIKIALSQAERVSKEFEFLEAAHEDFKPASQLLSDLEASGVYIDPSKAVDTVLSACDAVDVVVKSKSHSETCTAFVDSSKTTLKQVLEKLGRCFLKNEILPWMQNACSVLSADDSAQRTATLPNIDSSKLNQIVQRKALEEVKMGLECCSHLQALCNTIHSLYENRVMKEWTSIDLVRLVKQVESIQRQFATFLSKEFPSVHESIQCFEKLFKGCASSKAAADIDKHFVAVGKLLAKAGAWGKQYNYYICYILYNTSSS